LIFMAVEHAERARALVGTRFRLQGRGEHGLDCIGLVIAAFGLDAREFRRDYRLHGQHPRELETGLAAYFRRVAPHGARAGDVMLMAVDEQQLHLGVKTELGFVHAHAGIGRVVETPGAPDWPVLGIYRLRGR
jgi:lipoprotein Spr